MRQPVGACWMVREDKLSLPSTTTQRESWGTTVARGLGEVMVALTTWVARSPMLVLLLFQLGSGRTVLAAGAFLSSCGAKPPWH